MKDLYYQVLTCLLLTTVALKTSIAQVYPADFGQTLVANGINDPTVLAFAPDGRIFVAQQAGSLRVIKNNALLATPFVTLTVSSTGERGLLGIALDPDFAVNNYIYLYYTVPSTPAHNRISRFTANGDVVEPGSESIVLELDPLSSATNHNGGAMHFGKDGKLYVAIGENATASNAQNLDTYHGKLLRINKDGSVPSGNPFTTGSEQRKRVWAYGLRNPYTFAVHPTTGRILVNDVGQNTWEEINDATIGGKNFGWPTTEGKFTPATYPNFTNPIYVYQHAAGDGNGCAITGGTFFSPSTSNYPSTYVERYFFQDLCNNWINTIDPSAANPVRAAFATAISGDGLSITTGNDGNLYYLSRTSDALYKIVYNNSTSPFITNHPADVSVSEGQAATFSVTALGSTPLTYQWQKNGSNIPGATNSTLSFPDAALSDNGDYRVIVSNVSGSATSNEATLTVIANVLPVAEIITPTIGTTYAAGTNITFSGSGTDAEDGTLAAEALSWQVDFHHDTHKHDQPALEGITSGSFSVPNVGETSDNVWYRIILTVTDSHGSKAKDSVDVLPRKSKIRLTTLPVGLQLTVDGQPIQAPDSIVSVEGLLRTIGVVSPQEKNGITYNFESWSNQGDATQTFATPVDDFTLTATFSFVVGVEPDSYSDRVTIFPNPARQGVVTVSIPSTKVQMIKINMVDPLARNIVSEKAELNAGDNQLVLQFGRIGNGMYSIIIEMEHTTVFRRLVVADK